ncbi:MAG: cryptochrome/photolyase family protein [Planctomycetota bacterium]
MILLVFPHQLFLKHPGLKPRPNRVALIEDSLFFSDFHYPAKFHQQKLWLHRATMKRYQAHLDELEFDTVYCDLDRRVDSLKRHLKKIVKQSGSSQLTVCDPADFMLEKRLVRAANELDLRLTFLPNPGFINQPSENQEYRAGKKRWFMADFYKWQRRRLDVLMEADEPAGGKWSFDEDNRKKVPKKLLGEIPSLLKIKRDDFDSEAQSYVEKKFADHPGSLNQLYYPTSHQDAKRWLQHFLKHRFERFGDYEDAIVEGESWLWHSVLTPALNIGLLTPDQVIKTTLRFAEKNDVPINSSEGFVRQIIGWREFMKATYDDLGVTMRNSNHWNHHRTIPSSFYDGTTGIVPIDDTIRRLLKTGYCHHIERLMVLGGFMFLCEFHPREVYRWFMEMFIDSYDWVMVTNVYSMSQHADGGLTTTKPYFSGSSYVRKMSHYAKGDWCDIWDGLYWRWIWNHVEDLSRNPRWAMMCAMAKKMDPEKRERHLKNAEAFLSTLDDET